MVRILLTKNVKFSTSVTVKLMLLWLQNWALLPY